MKRRILLVDDEAAILLTLKTILEVHGFEVETAASGKEASSKLNANTYHLVITDMRMEHDKAGFDVIQAAKKMAYDPAIAILTAGALERRVLSRSWLIRGSAWWFAIPALASIIAVVAAIKLTRQPVFVAWPFVGGGADLWAVRVVAL